MRLAIFIALLIAIFAAVNADDEEIYEDFIKKHRNNKVDLARKGVFMTRLQKIKEHNEKYEKNEVSFEAGITEFTDYTDEELDQLKGAKIPNELQKVRVKRFRGFQKWQVATTSTTAAPSTTKSSTPDFSFDWRTFGAVNPIRNQGSCGSCWAFSAVSTWESAWFLKKGKLLSLSEQQLVDCSSSNNACRGGWMSNAWNDAKAGIMTGASYPYTASKSSCKYVSSLSVANLTSYALLKSGDEVGLANAVKSIGPISVAIYASGSLFAYYKGGVYYDNDCILAGTSVDHAVVVIGYGTINGADYWLIRNSWGTNWGINGYMMLARNRANHCNVASYGMYPIV